MEADVESEQTLVAVGAMNHAHVARDGDKQVIIMDERVKQMGDRITKFFDANDLLIGARISSVIADADLARSRVDDCGSMSALLNAVKTTEQMRRRLHSFPELIKKYGGTQFTEYDAHDLYIDIVAFNETTAEMFKDGCICVKRQR